MDDTAQNQIQNAKFKMQNSSQSQDDVQQSIQQPTPVQAPLSQPVGSTQKEQGPALAESPVQDVVTASEVEPDLPPEVKNAGVEILKTPQIPQDAQKLGVEPVLEAVPVITIPTGKITLPMTEEEALQALKTTEVKDSRHWIAALVEKAYRKLRQVIVKDN